MPIKKAFTLIEITIVVLLLGILYSLVLNNYKKKNSFRTESVKYIPSFIKNSGYSNGTFFIYGNFCEKGVFIDKKGVKHKSSNFNYPKDCTILVRDNFFRFSKVEFEDIRIDKKNERVCLALPYKNGRFFNKYIFSCANRWYLAMPFWQIIKNLKSIEKSKEIYMKENLYPQNEDDYYHE